MNRTFARPLAAVALLLGALLVSTASAAPGLRLRVWDNNGRVGTPTTDSVIAAPHVTLPADKPFSADIEGTIAFNQSGVYEFFCNFSLTTTAFVWVDGHMVCQDNHAYKVERKVMDNPLPIQGQDDGATTKTLPFRAHIVFNGSPPPAPCDLSTLKTSLLGCFDDTSHQCGFKELGSDPQNSWENAAAVCAGSASSVFAGAENGMGTEIWCGDAPPTCPELPAERCGKACPGKTNETCGDAWALQALKMECTRLPTATNSTVEVRWSPWSGNKPGPPTAIPTELLGSELPAAERQRETLQRGLASGWGPWLHSNMLALVSLPSAATVTTSICAKGSSDSAHCINSAQPDGHKQNAKSGSVRVGHHAYDRSYVQYFVGHSASDSLVGVNASVEYTASNGGRDIDVLVTPVGTAAAWDGVELVLDGRFAWFRAGEVSAASSSLSLTPAGLPQVTLYSTAVGAAASSSQLRLSLGNGPVGLSTTGGRSVASIASLLATALQAEEMALAKRFGPRYKRHGMAVKASVMWNLIFNPAENGAALLPVSRDWNFAPSPANDDWTYAVFDWSDNIFASMLAGFNKTIAYSNLIQVIKSKTAAGFVPNFAAGGSKSMDRTEPPIGAKVLSELYSYHKDKWIVELLFDDILDWNNWFMRRRLLPPLDLVALGSYNEEADITGSFAPQNMQNARFESGLDNSPMYDGEFYDSSNTFLMQLYDVGMSSMVVQEAYKLAELADAIGRPEAAMLRARGDMMSALIGSYLWDDESQIFVNKFPNNTFYRRVTPTSFYAMMTAACQGGAAAGCSERRAVSDAQATAMVNRWLLNSTRFCVSPTGDFAGNADSCYWGLPSINAADPAYPPLGYWRGYVWGPMAQLTHWSLEACCFYFDDVPAVRAARKALAKQMGSLMLSQWNQNRHICENYNPHKTADTSGGDCSGTKFYHWGALTGLIELQEMGYGF